MTELKHDDDNISVESNLDTVMQGIDEIKNLMQNVSLKPKKDTKQTSKKLPDDFDWSIVDDYIYSYFNGDLPIDGLDFKNGLSMDTLFDNFKYTNKEYKIPDMKYQFQKRCGVLCEVSKFVYCLKQPK